MPPSPAWVLGRSRAVFAALTTLIAVELCAAAAVDFSGFWRFKEFQGGAQKVGVIAFKEPYEAQLEQINRIADAHGEVPTGSKRCLPFGMPFGMVFFS